MNRCFNYTRNGMLIRFLSILVVFAPAAAFAAEYSAGGACATAGALHTKNDATGAYNLICNGTSWVDSLAYKTTGRIGINLPNPITTLEVDRDLSSKGYSFHIQRPVTGAGWARGMHFLPDGSTDATGAGLGGIGFRGSGANPPAWIYLTYGVEPWESTTGIIILANGNVGIGKMIPSVALDVVGDINYTGVVADVSDRRLKTAIHPLSNSLDKIRALNPVSFVMKDDAQKRKELGFIAQDVEAVFPELVVDNGDFKSLNYTGMIAPFVGASQEQQAQLDELQRQNDAISARLDALERAD